MLLTVVVLEVRFMEFAFSLKIIVGTSWEISLQIYLSCHLSILFNPAEA